MTTSLPRLTHPQPFPDMCIQIGRITNREPAIHYQLLYAHTSMSGNQMGETEGREIEEVVVVSVPKGTHSIISGCMSIITRGPPLWLATGGLKEGCRDTPSQGVQSCIWSRIRIHDSSKYSGFMAFLFKVIEFNTSGLFLPARRIFTQFTILWTCVKEVPSNNMVWDLVLRAAQRYSFI